MGGYVHTKARSESTQGALFGLLAAASFGVSAPLAKLLLGALTPTLLAGLLYLGAALALWGVRLLRVAPHEAPLGRSDVLSLVGIVALGGIAGPVLMLLGLRELSALTGSLLLNLEAPFTMLLALLVFREHLTRRALLAAGLILLGALLLRVEGGPAAGNARGIGLVALACACWAVDNNLTQRLSLRDPFAVVRVKTSCAGLVNTGLALGLLHAPWPAPKLWGAALLLGSVSYGASVVLDLYALRFVGAAREAAYFATAPFLGALLSFLLFDAAFALGDAAALVSMALGVVLLIRERHGHFHVHEPLAHTHRHAHDAHHKHVHAAGEPEGEPHAHFHRHEGLAHEHEHVSDLHHRHEH
jgi:drug/metabolite transporter (DMT)-like permease